MKTVCPACGAVASLDAFLTDAESRGFMEMFAKIPAPIYPDIPRYLALFRPRTGKVLQWKKATRLLANLLSEIKKGHIQIGGNVARPAAVSAWAEAMTRIIDMPPAGLPLQNHNYLKRICWDIADSMDRAREADQLKMERTHASEGIRPSSEPEKPLSLEEIRAIRERNMGGKIKNGSD